MPSEARFYILHDDGDKNDVEGTLSVKITDEGIVCDVENAEGEVIASWYAFAQDMVDEYCH